MRIVAGKYKGRPIQAPKTDATRPTTDRNRESLFNILTHSTWAPALNGARVIDLFAGSGALGLEAISRGAEFCLFVDTAHAARGAIRNNIESLGLFGCTRIHRRSAVQLGEKPSGVGSRFDLIFMDPPYHQDLVSRCLDVLRAGDWLSDEALIVAETAVDEAPDLDGWEIRSQREMGAARIWFLRPD